MTDKNSLHWKLGAVMIVITLALFIQSYASEDKNSCIEQTFLCVGEWNELSYECENRCDQKIPVIEQKEISLWEKLKEYTPDIFGKSEKEAVEKENVANSDRTLDFFTIPATPQYIPEKSKTIDEIIQETKINVDRTTVKTIVQPTYSSEEIVYKEGPYRKELKIHRPLIDGKKVTEAVPLQEKDKFTYSAAFKGTAIDIKFDSPEIGENVVQSKIDAETSWKIAYQYQLPSETFTTTIRISSSSPIQIIDEATAMMTSGEFVIDFAAERENGYEISTLQPASKVVYVYLSKNFTDEGKVVGDEIILDPTLTISGTRTELCGDVTQYDKIEVLNGGVLDICTKDQSNNSTGYANITLGYYGNFTVLSGSSVEGSGRGELGGARSTATSTAGNNGNNGTAGSASTTPNGGGGSGGARATGGDSVGGAGGAFGGNGGAGGYSALGTKSRGGFQYGSAFSEILKKGSGGGGASGDGTGGVGAGSAGGAGLKVIAGAGGSIRINGLVNLSGQNGTNGDATDDAGGGGGSGGHLILKAGTIDISSAAIHVYGARGGNAAGTTTSDSCGGGGGSGGRIVFIYETFTNTSLTTDYRGGEAGLGTDAACDASTDAGNSTAGNSGTSSFNLTYFDRLPTITLIAPANLTVNTTDTTPEFFFNASDEMILQPFLNCTLQMQNQTSTSNFGTNNTVFNATKTIITANSNLNNGPYVWWINCTDGIDPLNSFVREAISETRNITISITPPDVSPPGSVTNLENQSQTTTSIYWNWTNPSDPDFLENILYLNGNWEINTSNNFYNASDLPPDSIFTITVHTKDTSGNVNTTDVNGTARTLAEPDLTPPNVTNPAPALNSVFSAGITIELGANVTDGRFVSKVFANVTYPNTSVLLYELSNSSGHFQRYNLTFEVPQLLGPYTVSFIANDTSNNYNRTEFTNFTVIDTQAPKYTNLDERPSDPASYAKNKDYFFNITIDEPVALSNVTIMFNGINYTSPFVRNSTTWEFSRTDLAAGTYEYVWYMNDTSNNRNQTPIQTYTISQATGDLIFKLNNTEGDIAFAEDGQINASATSINNTVLLLRNGTDVTAQNNLFQTLAMGHYNYTAIAQNNQNFTEQVIRRLLIVTDGESPRWNNEYATPGSPRQYIRNYNYLFNITWLDNVAINGVAIYFNGTNTTVTHTNGTSWMFNITNLGVGTYNYVWYANDSARNRNQSTAQTFTITQAPGDLIFKVNDTEGDITLGSRGQVNVSAFSSNNSIQILRNGTDVTANNNIYVSLGVGHYNYTGFALENQNFTIVRAQRIVIVTDDQAPSFPRFFEHPSDPATYSRNQPYLFNATIVDNINVTSVYIEFNGTNYTTLTQNFTDWQLSISDLGVGSYNYVWYANDSRNNLNNSGTLTYTINQAPGDLLFRLNDTAGDLTFSYGGKVNASAYSENNSILVFQNNTAITNNVFGSILAVGLYNFSGVAESNQNFTRVQTNRLVTVTKAGTIVNLSLNNQDNGITVEVGTSVNHTAYLLVGSQGIIQLYRNGTLMNSGTSPITNTSSYNSLGHYNITTIYLETQNYSASQEDHTIIVIDTTRPSVTDGTPLLNSIKEAGEYWEIGVNVTDFMGVSKVFANVTYPNLSVILYELSNSGAVPQRYNISFTTLNLGLFNVSFIANDTSNNYNRTESTNFTVRDTLKPNVTGLIPVLNSVFTTGQSIEISANVTDRLIVSAVNATITRTGGTIITISLSNSTGFPKKFNTTYIIPVDAVYNVTFSANDTGSNFNNTEFTNFTASTPPDLVPPNVTNAAPTLNSQREAGTNTEIGVNVSDGSGIVSLVFANVSYPNGSSILFGLSNSTGNFNRYNMTFISPSILGKYNISFIANDSYNNYNRTEFTNFTVVDTTVPNVMGLIPLQNYIYNTGETIQIGANVTDILTVSKVFANITYPNSSIFLLELSNSTGNGWKYNISFTIPELRGIYNITIIANDSSTNYNKTEVTWFTAQDNSYPVLSSVIESPAQPVLYIQDRDYYFNVTVTDNIAVSNVWIQFNGINYSQEVSKNGNIYTFNRTDLGVNNYTYIWYANDTSNNLNFTIQSYSISKAAGDLTYKLNDTLGDISFGYGGKVNASAVSENNSVLVFQNSTAITNNIFGSILAVGHYNFSGIAESNQNYTGVQINRLVTVTQTPSIVNLSLNNQDNGITIEAGSSVNHTGYLLRGEGVIQLYRNGTLMNSGTSPITNISSYNSLGHFNITVIYPASQNYSSSQENHTIIIKETVPPKVTGLLPPSNSPYTAGQTIEISANVTDSFIVGTVNATITLPGGSSTTVALSNSTGFGNKFNNSYLIPTTGAYNVSFSATDISLNINNTERTNFTAVAPPDTTPPNVTALAPTSNSVFGLEISIEIGANVSDGTAVSKAYANLTYPNSSIILYELTNSIGDRYNMTFQIPNVAGLYRVYFIANDTSNNYNKTEFTNFTVIDDKAPQYSQLLETPADPSTYAKNKNYFFNITIDESIALSNVTIMFNGINYTGPFIRNSTTWGFTRTDLAAGTYEYVWYMNDTSNNRNQTPTQTYTISQAAGDLIFKLNDTQEDIMFGYGGRVNASAVSENGTIQIQRNGINVTANNNLFETLTAGQYNYTGIALESQNFTAVQVSRLLTITKAGSEVNLTFNGTDGDITISEGSTINISGFLVRGEHVIQLWRNGTLMNNGTSPVQNITTFNVPGHFNISLTSISTQNYSSSQEDHRVIVADVTPPASVGNLVNQSQSASGIFWNWTNPADSDFSQNIIYLNGLWQSNTSANNYNATGLNSNTSYTITVHTKDTSGNINTTDVNSTAKTDEIPNNGSGSGPGQSGGSSGGGGSSQKPLINKTPDEIPPIEIPVPPQKPTIPVPFANASLDFSIEKITPELVVLKIVITPTLSLIDAVIEYTIFNSEGVEISLQREKMNVLQKREFNREINIDYLDPGEYAIKVSMLQKELSGEIAQQKIFTKKVEEEGVNSFLTGAGIFDNNTQNTIVRWSLLLLPFLILAGAYVYYRRHKKRRMAQQSEVKTVPGKAHKELFFRKLHERKYQAKESDSAKLHQTQFIIFSRMLILIGLILFISAIVIQGQQYSLTISGAGVIEFVRAVPERNLIPVDINFVPGLKYSLLLGVFIVLLIGCQNFFLKRKLIRKKMV